MKRIATAPPRAELGFVDERALPDGRRFAPGVSEGALGRRSVREKEVSHLVSSAYQRQVNDDV